MCFKPFLAHTFESVPVLCCACLAGFCQVEDDCLPLHPSCLLFYNSASAFWSLCHLFLSLPFCLGVLGVFVPISRKIAGIPCSLALSCPCSPFCRVVAEGTLRWREKQQVWVWWGHKSLPSKLLHLWHDLGSAGVWKERITFLDSFLDNHMPFHCMSSIALWLCIFLFTKQVLSGLEEEPGEHCKEQGGVHIIIEEFGLEGTSIGRLD